MRRISSIIQSLLFEKLSSRQGVLVLGANISMRNIGSADSIQWNPGSIITVANNKAVGYAVVVLNRRVSIPVAVAQDLWENAYVRCTVDGGTNWWRQFLIEHCTDRSMKAPDYITGDFDSITEETRNFFNDPITTPIYTPDQNETDFTKSLMVIRPLLESACKKKRKHIIVFSDISGRFDQIMGCINTLYKAQNDDLLVFLLTGNSMTWLLRPGKHLIRVPVELVKNQRWCALIPIGNKATCVTTSGLKWNLASTSLEFGHLVSTSNTYSSECVHVETDSCLVWSMGLFNFDEG